MKAERRLRKLPGICAQFRRGSLTVSRFDPRSAALIGFYFEFFLEAGLVETGLGASATILRMKSASSGR